jgi:arylsulfate sulfotransferase
METNHGNLCSLANVVIGGKMWRRIFAVPVGVVILGASAGSLFAGIQIKLSPDLALPQPVGTTITWKATATDSQLGTLSYRFSTGPAVGPLNIVSDYQHASRFKWTPHDHEGAFEIQVTVRNDRTQATAQITATYQITSRVVGNQPVVTPTAHPLVALYSAPPCPVGSFITVKVARLLYTQLTSSTPCQANVSMNFYIAGMQANTTYQLSHQVVTGTQTVQSAALSFTTGSIPKLIGFPKFAVLNGAGLSSSLNQDILLHSFLLDQPRAVATDFYGNVTWYCPFLGVLQRPVAGGTMLMTGSGGSGGVTGDLLNGQLLKEIDLAGNVVRQTSAARVSEQLLAMGQPQAIDSFNHEALRLPNGYTAVIASVERIYPAGTQGSTQPVDILGNMIIVLDQNWQVTWFWNGFDHLNVSRAAILGETCLANDISCPPITLSGLANDWLHANSIDYIPSDGNLVVSLRNQDWIIKIDYSNGTGTGNVLWRLGQQGDFTMNSSDPYPWFTHQHDASYENGTTTTMSVYDNGNTRVAQNPSLVENSRGQVLTINEANRSVSLTVNVDLGVYSQAFGAAQLLRNGDYHFQSGWINPGLSSSVQDLEVTPAGTVEFELQSKPAAAYRSFRLSSFYLTN